MDFAGCPGRFIVVEGIDGAGTTTLATHLAAALPRARFTCEPSNQTVGTWLRGVLENPGSAHSALEGALALSSAKALKAPETLALLFAADRYMHLAAEVEPWLAAGETVVSDRYLYSSVGYQSYGASDPAAQQAWIRGLQPWARTPDLTLLVLVSPQTAHARREARGAARGLLEDDARQTWLAEYYRDLPRLFPHHPFVCLDGEAPPWLVLSRALRALAHIPNR
jgi:dTMP kinase